MKLNDLTFWVSPLTYSIFVGTINKRDKNLANQKRDITGLMMHGVVEAMRKRENDFIELDQEGKRYRLTLAEVPLVDIAKENEG